MGPHWRSALLFSASAERYRPPCLLHRHACCPKDRQTQAAARLHVHQPCGSAAATGMLCAQQCLQQHGQARCKVPNVL